MRIEKNDDWCPLTEMYTVDATYGWHNGPNEEFMAVGRDYALGTEMFGLDGWTYPYQKVIIDDRAGSWFRYAGAWQCDFYDFGDAANLFVEMITAGSLSDGMWSRMVRAAAPRPGHYPRGESPVEIW